jgi:hypothetical protein
MAPGSQIASAARRVFASFAERLAQRADEVSAALADELHLALWDREQLIGAMQARLATMAKATVRVTTATMGARVIELRAQPLEAIEVAWACLLAGRPVRVATQPGACSATASLVLDMASLMPAGAIAMGGDEDWPTVGVMPAVSRVAWVDATADRELAAYSLARTSLRRSGMDPRAVRLAYTIGPTDLLARHLRRLWVGAQLGPASDPDSFAGPVDPATADAFIAAQTAWLAEPRAEAWCTGGVLEHGAQGPFVAPAAFAVDWPVPELPLVGPMCCIVRCTEAQAREAIAKATAAGAAVVQIGGRTLTDVPQTEGGLRHIRGAVLVERLPPGLPEPRPA